MVDRCQIIMPNNYPDFCSVVYTHEYYKYMKIRPTVVKIGKMLNLDNIYISWFFFVMNRTDPQSGPKLQHV